VALFAEPHNPKKFQAHLGSQNALLKAQRQLLSNVNTNNTIDSTSGGGGNGRGLVGHRATSTSSLHSLASVGSTSSGATTPTTPHNPSTTTTPTTGRSSNSKRWRSLIVDLSPPAFRPPGNFSEEMLLLRPAAIAPGVFHQALKMLYQYLQQGGSSPTLELSKQALQQQGIQMPSTYYSTTNITVNANNANSNSVVCVSKGRAGELHIFGGLTVYPGCVPFALCDEFRTLNPGQAAAVRKVLLADDYALLLGLPGTGKTSTLSLVVRMMIARGQKVLLTSFTNSAVDHLMLKLVESGMTSEQIMRVGAKSSVHPAAQRFVLDTTAVGASVGALQLHVENVRLVACTVLTASRNQLVRRIDFDVCVMDEAGQIAQPAALGAVLCARTCVLVGDDYQLPPLVVSLEAQSKGMSVSLFKRFMEAHPAAVCSLTAQYRMNGDIMSVCNALIYEHRMQCASSAVAAARVALPQAQLIPLPRQVRQTNHQPQGRSDWLFGILQPNPAVVFLNTDNLACHLSALLGAGRGSGNGSGSGTGGDAVRGNSVSSASETAIVQLLVTALRAAKFDLKNVGVICPFRAQVELITSSLHSALGEEVLRECEVSTVDKYQGRDKEVIILSTVKSCADGKDSVGNLLRDWRRINVAITRCVQPYCFLFSYEMVM